MRPRPLAAPLQGALLAAAVAAGSPTCLAADDPPIEVNPNRPTFATPALTTQSGVVELEFGLEHTDLRSGSDLSWSPFLLKLGILRRLELRVGGNGLLHVTPSDGPGATGYGDTTLGAQWCFLPKGPLGIDASFQVTWKAPTANAAKGLGSGASDVLAMLLLSRDMGAFHVDVNALTVWLGRPRGGGDDTQPAGAVSVSRSLGPQWSLTGEIYSIGHTSQNAFILSNLWAVGYKVSTRLVLDAGVDTGLSHGAPRISFFSGLTYGVCRFRHPGHRT
jgi:hypothetical protein